MYRTSTGLRLQNYGSKHLNSVQEEGIWYLTFTKQKRRKSLQLEMIRRTKFPEGVQRRDCWWKHGRAFLVSLFSSVMYQANAVGQRISKIMQKGASRSAEQSQDANQAEKRMVKPSPLLKKTRMRFRNLHREDLEANTAVRNQRQWGWCGNNHWCQFYRWEQV